MTREESIALTAYLVGRIARESPYLDYTPEEVLRKTALSAAAVFRALTRLELEGLAFRTPQGTYYRKRQV